MINFIGLMMLLLPIVFLLTKMLFSKEGREILLEILVTLLLALLFVSWITIGVMLAVP